MTKVKTFTSPLKIFQTREELDVLDGLVNAFLKELPERKVISVSDACTSGDTGATIGIIRVVTYKEKEE
jgi:hypothetical protein